MEAEKTITTELAKQNVTEAVIADLKKKYLPLKINGIEDKEGYKAVHDARIVCRDHRTLTEKICKKGRENAIKEQKAWLAKEKEVVAKISEVEQYLKKQEDAIDAEKEAIKIKAERLLKLPARKEQMKGIEKFLGELEDEQIMRFDDAQWNEVIVIAQGKKLAEQQKAIDDANAKKLLERTIARENELIALGAVIYSDGIGKVYRKGKKTAVSEQAIKECVDERWEEDVVAKFKQEYESIAGSFKHTIIPSPNVETIKENEGSMKLSSAVENNISDEEKLWKYASALEKVPVPELNTVQGKELLSFALKHIESAIEFLRQ